jgi:hypothetical protein
MTFGNKLLLVICVTHIQLSTLFASQALCKTSDKQLSITIDNTAECIEIEEETLEETSEQELKNKVCEEGVLKGEIERDASETAGFSCKNLRVAIEEAAGECIEATDEPDCLQSSLTEQELKNKVCEEVVNSASSPGTVQEAAQNSITEKLAFSDADVRHYLNECSIRYDDQCQVSVQNGKAACALAVCQTLALQKNEKGMSFFIPCEITAPVLITNPGITQVKVIRASALITNPGITQVKVIRASARKKCWIEVYLGYNPQMQTTVGSDKIYEASILLLQKSLPFPWSQKVVQSQPPAARSICKPNKQ